MNGGRDLIISVIITLVTPRSVEKPQKVEIDGFVKGCVTNRAIVPKIFYFSHSFFLPTDCTISGMIVFLINLFCMLTSLWSGLVGLFFLVLMPGLCTKKALSRTKKS